MQMRLTADIETARHDGGKPVDLVHLSAQTMGDRALEADVLRIFLSQAPVWMGTLTRTGGNEARREAAHTLKGSARAIGAFRLADLATRSRNSGVFRYAANCKLNSTAS